jgi:hypothetical protein
LNGEFWIAQRTLSTRNLRDLDDLDIALVNPWGD